MPHATLKEMLAQAQAAATGTPVDRSAHGRRRAVIQCVHANGPRYTVGEVRGDNVFDTYGPFSLLHETDPVVVSCEVCPADVSRTALNLSLLRAALGRPHNGVLKVNRDEVGTRLRLDE